jgi:hypothetical protein
LGSFETSFELIAAQGRALAEPAAVRLKDFLDPERRRASLCPDTSARLRPDLL